MYDDDGEHKGLFDGTVSIPYEYSPVQLQPSTPLTSVR